jgi:hypothetical protein
VKYFYWTKSHIARDITISREEFLLFLYSIKIVDEEEFFFQNENEIILKTDIKEQFLMGIKLK